MIGRGVAAGRQGGPDAAAGEDRDIGPVLPAHAVGDEVAGRRLLAALEVAAALEDVRGGPDLAIEQGGQLGPIRREHRRDRRVGDEPRDVSRVAVGDTNVTLLAVTLRVFGSTVSAVLA